MTTVLELYIGFLVGASSNRSERNLELTLAGIARGERKIRDVEEGLRAATLDEIRRRVSELTA